MNESVEPAIVRKRLLENYFVLYDELITLSAGDWANNKIDMELMEHDETTQALVMPPLARLVSEFEPDFVAGVPNGATWLAEAVAARVGCDVVRLTKDETRNVDYKTYRDAESVAHIFRRGVLLEDVSRTFANVRRTLALGTLASKVVGVVTVMDRAADRPGRQLPAVPVRALVADNIPEILPYDPRLRRQFETDRMA